MITPRLSSTLRERGPSTSQGRSLVALFAKRPPTDWRKDVYYHYYGYLGFHAVRAHYGVRDDRYKMIRFYSKDINSWESYDLKTDPGEMRNRIDDPAIKNTSWR